MRRTIGPVLPLIVAALSGAAGVLATFASAAQTSPAARLQANRTAARADVAVHLSGVRMPSDVTRISTEPTFAKTFAFGFDSGQYAAEQHAMWSTAASPQTIIAYVRTRAPAGSTADVGTGSKTGVTSTDIQFSWPDLAQQLLNRMLTVTVVTPRHGNSVVIAQAQSSWVVPRSSAEVVPSRVRAVLITLRLGPSGTGPVVKPGGHVQTSSYLVWRPARVRALVDEFNGLAIVQPAAEPISCPMMLTGSEASELTLAFKSGRNGATLARAAVSAHRGKGWYDGAGACDPIDFWIGSRQQTPLMSTTFVKQVGTLIGASIS